MARLHQMVQSVIFRYGLRPRVTRGFDAKRKVHEQEETPRDPEAVSFAQARDEMFSHILRCGVIDALPEHQKDWFDDTMLYLADRYEDLTEEELAQLRVSGRAVLPAGPAKVEAVESGAA